MGGKGRDFLQVQGAAVVALNGCVGVAVGFLGGRDAFLSGLGGDGLSLDFGSGMSRWGDIVCFQSSRTTFSHSLHP